MSAHRTNKRLTVPTIRRMKGGDKIVSLTAYSAWMARLIDSVTDVLIVGDSMAMVEYGMSSTLGLPLDTVIGHCAAVDRVRQRPLLVCDLPFASFERSPQQAYESAARVIAEGGADAVKLECTEAMAETVAFLVQRGIPVMSHIGLMPQHVNAQGGFRRQGKGKTASSELVKQAKMMAHAGAFSLLLEGIYSETADLVTKSVTVPTIGIGASLGCDGQVLVTEDILGLTGDDIPGFARIYQDLKPGIEEAAARFADDVREGLFPQDS
ncbi:3-methyl-2-oxobutanoate hydroxymethyltransferase [uncultured Salinisphaera sp.]|uniref:3-methyl-2-oxobutanoate hydroxymethyltransferase n=1 Tax=uncultured Salinisphaera sp. TaxID=359372 RepID=UPI0032B2D600|tara:strand:+ start:715 stop:1515 length:801 start_codon:yes stop_codon:yes gene_type:complete